MDNDTFWRAMDAALEKTTDGVQQLRSAASKAADSVQTVLAAAAGAGGVWQEYCESAEFLRRRLGDFNPEVLMILGSGLGFLGDEVVGPVYVDYGEIPHFRHSTAPGHKGRFVFGTLEGRPVAIMQGRIHTYEGYTMDEVAYGVRVAHLLGIGQMIVTNAAGAIRDTFEPGDIMLITDHIKLFAGSPLTGPNLEQFGPRFPDMSHAYDPVLQDIARTCAGEQGIPLREGVYMFFPGPQFETPAEIRAARILGADAAGMSTVPEVIAANHCGMRVLGFSLCTNMAAGILNQPLSEQEVLDVAEKAKGRFSALVRGCLARLNADQKEETK